jgi:hypothetical protein
MTDALSYFIATGDDKESAEDFQSRYEDLLLDQQRNLGLMEPTPTVSLSAKAVLKRRNSDGK